MTASMNKRYQVFLSSTYKDLKNERRRVFQALRIGGRYLVAGMEDFPPQPGPVWTIIENTIKESDYYLLIVAARYGTMFPGEDISYTEKEFYFAKENNIPCIILLKSGIKRLPKNIRSFRDSVAIGAAPGYWQDEADLCSQAISALRIAEETPPPARGWVRGTAGDSVLPEKPLSDVKQGISGSIQINYQLKVPNYYNHVKEHDMTENITYESLFMLLAEKTKSPHNEREILRLLDNECLNFNEATEFMSELEFYEKEGASAHITNAESVMESIRDYFSLHGLMTVTPTATGGYMWQLSEEGKRCYIKEVRC
jgi:hypothetical protein